MPQPGWTETRDARRLLRRRFPIERIALEFDGRYTGDEIMAAVLEQRAKERDNARELKVKTATVTAAQIEPRSDVMIPPEVLADRARRANLVHVDTTALRMNDPLPGYSALERAPSITPAEIARDPLDYLIFRRRKTGMRFG